MEESLVLDVCQSWVMQKVAEHETSRLVLHTRLLEEILTTTLAATIRVIVVAKLVHCIGVFQVLIFGIFLVGDGIFTCLLIQVTLHQDIEEVSNGSKVSQLTIDIDSPEVWMR